MNESTIVKSSIVLSILGIILIFLIPFIVEERETHIKDVNKNIIGEYVNVCGIVSSQSISQKGTHFIKIIDNDAELSIVFFEDAAKALNTSKINIGDNICIRGSVTMYKNALEVIGSSYHAAS